jgi:hypothetical protein
MVKRLGSVSIEIPDELASHPRIDEALATAVTMQTQRESAVIYPRQGAPLIYWGSKQYLRLPPDAPLEGALVAHSHALFSGVGDAGPSPEDVERLWRAKVAGLLLRDRHALWVIAFPMPMEDVHRFVLEDWFERDEDAIMRHDEHLLCTITSMALEKLSLPFTLTRAIGGKLGAEAQPTLDR